MSNHSAYDGRTGPLWVAGFASVILGYILIAGTLAPSVANFIGWTILALVLGVFLLGAFVMLLSSIYYTKFE